MHRRRDGFNFDTNGSADRNHGVSDSWIMNDNISRKTRLTTTVGQSVLLRPIVIVGIAYSLSQHFDAVDVIFTHKFISFFFFAMFSTNSTTLRVIISGLEIECLYIIVSRRPTSRCSWTDHASLCLFSSSSAQCEWGARSANLKLVWRKCIRQTVLEQTALLSTKTPSVHSRPIKSFGSKQNVWYSSMSGAWLSGS